jgi:signal transduction histidine kinase
MSETEILREFSQALTATLTLPQLLPPLTHAAERLCQLQGIAIGLLVSDSKEIELYTQTDPTLHAQRVPLEDALMRDILQTGWPVHIADLTRPPLTAQLLQILSQLGYASLLVVPLRAAHRVIGVLLACWRTRRSSIARHKEELLQRLADQIAQAIVNIRLHAEQERHLRESEALRRVGQSISATLNLQDILKLVTEEGARLLGCETAALTLCTAEHEVEIAGACGAFGRWTGLQTPLATSLTRLVIRERRAIRQADISPSEPLLQEDSQSLSQPIQHSFLAVPLWQEEKPMGALVVSTTDSRVFSLDDERILQALADQAVHAITNAQLYTQLQEALQREQEANRQKSAFFASASHELRTPLNIILGYVDLVHDGVVGKIDQEAEEILGRVRRAVHHLIVLINDLLDLARIERAEFHLTWEPVSLDDLLNELCSYWEKPIHDKGLSLRRVGDTPLPLITSDRGRLRQILDNLLGNALKFTQVGQITIGTRVHERSLEIWVKDTGIGIDQADQNRIFDEFWQIEQEGTSRFNGVGLGLAVCKKLVHILGGSITLESTLNRGSTFSVILPR